MLTKGDKILFSVCSATKNGKGINENIYGSVEGRHPVSPEMILVKHSDGGYGYVHEASVKASLKGF